MHTKVKEFRLFHFIRVPRNLPDYQVDLAKFAAARSAEIGQLQLFQVRSKCWISNTFSLSNISKARLTLAIGLDDAEAI